MKKLIYIIVIILLGIYAWQKFDIGQYLNRVKIDIAELKDKEDTAQKALDERTEARKDIYQILVLMNEVTINTMKLEQMGEGKKLGSDQLTMKQQLEEKMKLLKEQLAEAREYAKENAELSAELEHLQHSFLKREQTIKQLIGEGTDLDEKIQMAIDELEIETEKLSKENDRLALKNAELRTAVINRKASEISAWKIAGEELNRAANSIPEGNYGKLYQGKQSEANHALKQSIIEKARECFNNGKSLAEKYKNLKEINR